MNCSKKPIPMDGIVTCVDGELTFVDEKFLEFYPEFSRVPSMSVNTSGTTSVAILRECSFGPMLQLAVGLLTAHRLATLYDLGEAYTEGGMNDQSSSEVGTNISAATGSLSQGSAPLSLVMGDDPFTVDLAGTKYGLQLLALISTWIPAADIVGGRPIGRFLYSLQWPPVNAGY